MDRRRLLACLALIALAPRSALARPVRVPATDAFPMLDSYLELPPEKRDRFSFAYRAFRKTEPAPDAKAALITADGTRTPVVFTPDGAVTNLPTLDQLKHKAMFEIEGPGFGFLLEPLATIPLADHIAVAELALSLAQVNAAIVAFAGPDAGSLRNLTACYFPGAAGGDAVQADGAAKPLPSFDFKTLGPTEYFEPRRAEGAVTLAFAQAPSRIILATPPRR
jgi:hypothetical protein